MNHYNTSSTSSAFRAITEYIDMGWALIPVEGLQDVDQGICLCGKNPCGLGNRNAGKHPASGRSGWQNGPAMTIQEAYHIWEEDCPDYNVGARTGEASGFFALDVEAEGLQGLADLEALHGKLPTTRIHRTGSGGRHYLFTMPNFEVRNSVKKLAPHIDIRGTGGMIVIPPSVSAKGAYSVERDAPIAPAPTWLLDWLQDQVKPQAADLGDIAPIAGLPPYEQLPPDRQADCQHYALSVIERETARYRDAPLGSGNATLFSAACNIMEIVQSPWNTFTYTDIDIYLDQARKQRAILNPGHGQDRDEYLKTVMSARLATAGKGRPLPPDRSESLLLKVPFTPVESVNVGQAFGNPNPFTTPDVFTAADIYTPPSSPSPPEVVIDPVEALLTEMLDRDALGRIPRPQPLIFDVLDKDSEAWLVAPPGGFKSFIALDMAIHVGMNLPWRGKEVRGGPVVYIVAEGSKGIEIRVEAWEKTYGKRSSGVKYLPRPVQASDEVAWDTLIEACRRLKPVLVVIDTQARVTVGMEENSAKEMGAFIRAVSRLRRATAACVLVVHHTGKSGIGARGSSALVGAMDSQLTVSRPTKKEERLSLSATIDTGKQKDMSEDFSIEIQMRVVDLGPDPDTGRPLSSLALEPYDPFWKPTIKPEPEHRAKLTQNQADILESLREHADNEYGATSAEIRIFIKEDTGREVPRGSVSTAMDALIKAGLVTRIGSRYVLSENVEI